MVFGFSSEWKENIDFILNIAALFILFFLHKSQNVSDKATHLKLDELLCAVGEARNQVILAEEKSKIDRMRESVAECVEENAYNS